MKLIIFVDIVVILLAAISFGLGVYAGKAIQKDKDLNKSQKEKRLWRLYEKSKSIQMNIKLEIK